MGTIRLFRCLVPLRLPQATLQISVFRPVPITPRQLFSDIMRSIHFTLCEDQLPKTRFLCSISFVFINLLLFLLVPQSTALDVSEDAGGYRSVYCMNVFYRGAERMPYKALIGRRPMSAFFKNYPEWG